MVLAAAKLLWGQDVMTFRKGHNISSEFLVIHIKRRVHQMNCSHSFNIEDSHLLKNLDIGENLQHIRGKSVLVGKLKEQNVHLIQHWVGAAGSVVIH